MTPGIRPETEDCRAVADILSRIGDKWTVFVVGRLSEGPARFNEMRREINGISQRMLALTLRGLERDGLVSRTVYPSVPPKVEYALTATGGTLIQILCGLGEWARENRQSITAARARFDAAQAPVEASAALRLVG